MVRRAAGKRGEKREVVGMGGVAGVRRVGGVRAELVVVETVVGVKVG